MGAFSNFLSAFQSHRSQIFIHTDKQQYYAGERVTGTISLAVMEPLHVDGVYLKLKGYQMTRFQVAHTRQVYDPNAPGKYRTVTEYQSHVQKDTFFRRRFCLYAAKCTLSNASFVFPFDFVLDTGLPGAFTFGRPTDDTYARVLYKVKAEVVVPGFLSSNIKSSQELLINEPLRQQLASTETHKEANVTFCCCFPRGRVSMSAGIDKNAYAPGETCLLRLVVDNRECQSDMQHISFKLVRSLVLIADGHTRSRGGTMIKSTTPAVRAGEQADRTIPLRLPRDCEPSCTSKLIQCEYTLQIVLSVPWSTDVVLSVPVQIYAPQLITYTANIVYPPNWNPQIMPTAHIQAANCTQY